MEEAFWWDASGTVTIYRKPGDGVGESLYKTIEYRPTSRNTVVSETLTQSGVYRVESYRATRRGTYGTDLVHHYH